MRISNAYPERVMSAAEADLVVVQQFMRVIGMIDSPARLLRPAILVRLARTNRRLRADA
jgi:hypothetical protein